MLNAKILAETEMNQHSGKILATIAFQMLVHLRNRRESVQHGDDLRRPDLLRSVYRQFLHCHLEYGRW